MKNKMPYSFALEEANRLVEWLRPAVSRIEIAGSLRRGCAEVGDLEIVCIPSSGVTRTLFTPPEAVTLDERMERYTLLCGQERYRQYIVKNDSEYGAIYLDLFITTPEQWGVIYAIRTGSSDFSKWLVTSRQKGGALPSNMVVDEGRVWVRGCKKALYTPEEADFFRVIGLPWVEPEKRAEGRWHK